MTLHTHMAIFINKHYTNPVGLNPSVDQEQLYTQKPGVL